MPKITPDLWMKSWDPHVKKSLEYPTESLGVLYTRAMAKFPEKPACWMINREITYRELLDHVTKFASFLQQNGVEKGDVVTICLPNCPQYLIAHFGTLLIGAVSSGLNPLLSESECVYQLNNSRSKVIVTMDVLYDKRLKKILDIIPALEIIIATNISEYMGLGKIAVFMGKLVGKIPKGKVDEWPGRKVIKFSDIMENTSTDVKIVEIDVKNDLALLQYTGGTTGTPKGAELTHSNIIAMHTQFTHWCSLDDKEVALSAFPAFHIGGLIVVTQAVWVASSQILIPNPRDSDHFIKSMIEKKPTILGNVPTLYGMVMNNPKSKDIPKDVLENVTVYISAAAPFPAEMIRDFEKHMQAENKVMELYGLTETTTNISNPFFGKKKVGKIGLPLPDTYVKLVDIETGDEIDTGEPGEILIKGSTITRGYFNDQEATEKAIDDGWFHTGDIGVMDDDGYIQIVDRIKDMLIISGYKVFSVHVEDVLSKHPDIELATIIGLDDPNRPGSQIVKAFVKLKEGVKPTYEVTEDIKFFAIENLSKYEKPTLWEFREELPLTTVGKVLKRALRDESISN
ncbi:MAG: AMP-binding protein [Candidatus Heimdallarchaeota archaeon]|nr:MAG: AMP-binding protein [Candidatus Heimdallarchaeota archaeon]